MMRCLSLSLMLSALLASGCGVKTKSPAHKPLPAVPGQSPSAIVPTTQGTTISLTPCEFWNRLPEQSDDLEKPYQVFQVFDQLSLRKNPESGSNELWGRTHLARAPQLLFGLSAEYNKGRKPVDVPNLEQFLILASEQYQKGELSAAKYYLLMSLDAHADRLASIGVDVRKKLIKVRNDAVIEKVEQQLPGIYSGSPGPMNQAKLVRDFLSSAGFASFDAALLYRSMLTLQKKVPLFPTGGWKERTEDLRTELEILTRNAADTSLDVAERACRFGIAQRVSAQILMVKGMQGVPAFYNQGGRLFEPTQKEDGGHPQFNLRGDFDAVVSADWIASRLKDTKGTRPFAAESTLSFLESFRYFVTLSEFRDPSLWALEGEVPRPGTLKLNGKLLTLGVGLVGLAAKTFGLEEMKMDAKNHIILRNDSPEALAELVETSYELSTSFKSFSNPSALELTLFPDESTREKLGTIPDKGLSYKFTRVFAAAILESIARVRQGRANEALVAALHRIGQKTGNLRLQTIELEGPQS